MLITQISILCTLPTELLGRTGSVQSNDLLGAKAQPAPLDNQSVQFDIMDP
jgi:hypothetical protein